MTVKTIILYIVAGAAAIILTGCMAAARHAVKGLSGDDDKAQRVTVPQAIQTAQEKAINKAGGGQRDVMISWSDPKSGLEGTMTWDATVIMTYSCRRYRQTMTVGNQILSGPMTACPQGDGTWKVTPMPSE